MCVSQCVLYSSALLAKLHCPFHTSPLSTACLTMPCIQFDITCCQFYSILPTAQHFLPVLQCPSLCSVHPANFKMEILQFNTPCQFYSAPHSVQYTLPILKWKSCSSTHPASFTVSLIQLNTLCYFYNVSHSVQQSLPVLQCLLFNSALPTSFMKSLLHLKAHIHICRIYRLAWE
jgi:hypothetical protein